MTGYPAARLGDPVAHTAAMGGFEVGGLLGFAAGVALVAFTVATAGTGLVAVAAVVAAVGAGTAMTGGGALMGMNIGHTYTNTVGGIITGSPNVIINGRPAARAIVDKAECSNHGAPQTIAQGSKIVFTNTDPAARRGDLVTCGAFIADGSPNVVIGREPATYVSVSPEVPAWMVKTAGVMVIAGTAVALTFGAGAALLGGGLCGLGAFGLSAAGGIGGSILGGKLGGAIGQALGGEKGQAWGEALGGLAGGAGGGMVGANAADGVFAGHPVNVATGQLLTSHTDFVLGGPLPLVFRRTWWSGSTLKGELGLGWHHTLDMAAIPLPSGERLAVRLEDGRFAFFTPPTPEVPSLNTVERMQLWTDGRRLWATDYDAKRYEFGPPLQDGLRRLVAVTDPNGNAIHLSRDATGRLQRITDSTGRVIQARTDEAGRLLALDGPAPSGLGTASLVTFRYYTDGTLAEAADAAGAAFAYRYDNALMTQEKRPAGVRFAFRWDDPARGRAARCVETWGDPVVPGGERLYARHLDYDPIGHITIEADDAGRQTRHDCDGRGLVVATTDPLGGRTIFSRDEAGRLTAELGPGGRSRSWGYDGYGRLTSRQEAGGANLRFSYADPVPGAIVTANAITVSPPAGGTLQRRYDDRLNLVAATDTAGWQTRVLRDARGLPLAVQDPLGTVARYSWTPGGELSGEADATGVRTEFQRDRLGRIIGIERAGEEAAALTLDEVGRPVTVTRGSRMAQFGYDAEGHVSSLRDPLGNETRWEYGGLPFPLRRVAANGTAMTYHYDGELQVVALANAKGEMVQRDYDAIGRLVREMGFDGREKRYTYGAHGWLAAVDDAGRVTSFDRDPAGRMTARTLADGAVERFGYDADGLLVSAATTTAAVQFKRDHHGSVVQEQAAGLTLHHQRDGRGRLTSTALPDGRVIQVGYDAAGRFTALAFAGQVVTQLRRDAAGREVARRAGALTAWMEYDPQGRLMRQQARLAPDRAPLLMREYGYDDADRLLAESDLREGVRRFELDPDEWLLAVDGPAPERFTYDLAGNLQPVTDELAEPSAAVGDRLLLLGDRKFEYDDRGNRVGERRGAGGGVQVTYRYDGADRLVECEEVSRLGRQVVRFAYDALGRRTRKTVERTPPPPANDAAAPGATRQTTNFIWFGDVLLAEATARGDAPPADPLATVYLHEPRTFRPLAQIVRRDAEAAGELFHYHLDRIGTPREITDDNGDVVWSGALRAWGGLRRQGAEALANPIRFQGQYADAETGLHYNRNRFYDPGTASFISQDPIGLDGGTNLYRYVPNPAGWVDPLGLACAFVDSNGTLNLNNKFAPGSPEDAALQQHVADWNQQISNNGGSMTRQAVTPQMRDAANTAIAQERAANPSAYSPQSPGMVGGHVPDVGWGGNTAGPIAPLNSSVNSYVGGATQAVPAGTSYNSVVLK